jgi:hypothetical protein
MRESAIKATGVALMLQKGPQPFLKKSFVFLLPLLAFGNHAGSDSKNQRLAVSNAFGILPKHVTP